MRIEKHFAASRANGATHGAHFTTNIFLQDQSEQAGDETCVAPRRRFQPAGEVEPRVVSCHGRAISEAKSADLQAARKENIENEPNETRVP